MARRSDFAQKLLDDLRLRKERLASSQSSNTSMNPTFADAYAYSKRGYTGPRETKKLETTSSRGGGTSNMPSSGTEIVPFGRPQKPEKIGDLSMVLSFALENGGQITKAESSGNKSFFKFLQQIGKRRMGLRKTEKRTAVVTLHQSSTSQLPALSHLQVEKISNGVEKLNQILQVYGNGLNLDGYSIEIGKELLKGAMDLEESLQMLVSLQEGSGYMSTPRRKSTVTLLEHDEDDDSTVTTGGQKQLARLSFSSEKNYRNYCNGEETAKSKLGPAAVNYSSQPGKFNEEKNQVPVASNPRYQKRSVSYDFHIKTTPASFSEQKCQNAPQPKKEKGRISNVIAKLMGLDDTPGSAESRETRVKESSSKPRAERVILKRTVKESARMEETTKVNATLVSSTVKQKEIKTSKTLESQGSQNGWIQVTDQPLRGFDDIKPVSNSTIETAKIEKQEKNVVLVNHHIGGRYEPREERKQDAKHKEHRDAEKGEVQPAKAELHRRSKSLNNLSQGNPLKLNNLGLQQDQMLRKPEPQEKKHRAEEMDRQTPKQKLLDTRQIVNVPAPNNSLSPMHIAATLQKRPALANQALKKDLEEVRHNTSSPTQKHLTEHINGIRTADLLDVTHQGDISRGRSLANHKVKMKDSSNMNFTWNSKIEDRKAKDGFTQPAEDQASDVRTTMKARNVGLPKVEMPQKKNEVMTKKGGNAANFSGLVKHQSLNKEEKQRRQVKPIISGEVDCVKPSRSKELEVLILKSQKPIPSAATPSAAEAIQNKAEQDPNFCNCLDDQRENLSETQTLAAGDSREAKISKLKNDQQDEEPSFSRDEEFKIHRSIISNEADGPCDESTEYSISGFKHCPTSNIEMPGQLTESENQLKQILVKNQQFVNTAEAIFKLNIPFVVLQASEPRSQDEDSKLLLDCSYEVMKRKGRRKELSVHPFVKASTTNSTRVKTLDDLIRQLGKDIESLKSYGKEGKSGALFSDLLPKMVESDVNYKDADLNSMWDYGWDDMMFMFHEKDDVIRDVERQVLDRLIDEVTRELRTSVSVWT